MTQENKQLLLKDLCARLLYGVKADCCGTCINIRYVCPQEKGLNCYIDYFTNTKWESIEVIKPYLRPMSSMTEEEKEELKKLFDAEEVTNNSLGFIEGGTLEDYISQVPYTFCGDVTDWLLAHHFDYRGLIEKGLAIEAPEGMYNIN